MKFDLSTLDTGVLIGVTDYISPYIYGTGFGVGQGKLVIDTDTLVKAFLWSDSHITDTIPVDMSRGFKPVRVINNNHLIGISADSLRVLRPYAR